MKDQFTISLRKIGMHLALSMIMLLMLALAPGVSMAQNTVDIGLFNSTTVPNQVEVKVRPNFTSTTAALTNIQFTIRWDAAASVGISAGSPLFPYLLAPASSGTSGGYNYQSFASVPGQVVNWVAGNEYTVLTFTYNTCTGFELAPATDAWVQLNNGVYYVEMFTAQLDHTGNFYNTPLVCISPFPATASNPVPANGSQYVAYNGSNQIGLGWDYVADPLYNDPDSFLVTVGLQTFTVPFVSGQTTYANAVQIAPPYLTTVNWSVTPFNNNGNAGGVPTWSFLSAPAPLTVDAMATGASTICLGASANLLADPSGGVSPMSFAWSPAGSLDNDTLMQPVATPSVTTTYTVTVTDMLGSTATDAVTIVVNEASVAFSADQTICAGGCTEIGATGGLVYSWGDGVQSAFVNVCPVQHSTYNLTVTDTNGCVATHTFNVFVNPLPIVALGAIGPFCAADAPYAMTEGTPAGGTYSGSAVIGSTFDPSMAMAGFNTVTYTFTDTNGCTNEATTQVEVFAMPVVDFPALGGVCVDGANISLTAATPAGGVYSGHGVTNGVFEPAVAGAGTHTLYYAFVDTNGCAGADSTTIVVYPAATASAGADVALCAGECTDLTATGGVAFLWSNGAQTALINVCPAQTSTFNVTVTDVNGCMDVAEVVVTINALPTVSAGADQALCAGECTTLQASGAASYVWSNALTTTSISVCPVETTTYTVVGTDLNGCVNSASVTVTVNALPVVNLPSFQGVCIDGAAFSLTTGTPAGGTYSGHGVSNNMFNPAAAGVGIHWIYYSYSDNIGCSGSDSASIEVFALPTASAGANLSICEGSCTDLTATGGVSYAWSNGGQTATINVCPTQQTLYTVTVTDAHGCVANADVLVSLFALPVADAGQNQSICAGDCINLLASGGDTYAWSNGMTGAAINVCPTQTTTFVVTVTDANGCQDVDNVTITVDPVPVANAGADAAICLGDCATLTASGGASFLWSTGATTASITVCPTVNTTYTVTVSNAGCTASDDVNVNVDPAAIISGQPVDVAVDLGATASFSVIVSGASGYQWEVSTDGGSTWNPVADGPVYQGATTGTLVIGVTTLNLDGYKYRALLGSPCGPSVITNVVTLSVVAPAISALMPNMTSCASEVVVPIILVKTIGVGAISLTMNFDPSVLVYDGFQNLHPSLLNGFVTVVNPTANSVYFSWYSINPLNILYDTLVELVFHSPNGGTSALTFDLVTPGNCEFSDVATNVIPASYFAGSVVAIPSPVVTTDPADADITEGQNVSFSISATNATFYQWQMSDDNGTSWYNLTDGAMYQGTHTGTLSIFGATVFMDEYQYRCIASGTCSPEDVSDAAHLNVRPIINAYIGQVVRCADEVIIPIHVTHAYGIAGVSLTLGFNTVVLNYVGLHSSHPDLSVGTLYDNSTFGRVYLSWFSTTPVDLGDTILVELRFTANPGTSTLVWDLSLPDNCQFNNLASEIIQTVWQDGSVTVNQTPMVYNVTGGGEYCSGGAGVAIGLSGSQTGRSYSLFRNDAPTGQSVMGTGSAISFGMQTVAGTYTVVATNPLTGCDSEMQGFRNVVINPLPVANAGGDVSILQGTSVVLNGSVTLGTPGFSYLWTPGAMATEDVTVSPATTQGYTFQVTDSKGCMDIDDVTVTVYANTISGQVTYDNNAGSPMSNVTVYLNNDSKAVVATATTNASGYYSFPPVPNGSYTITAATTKAWGGVNSTDALAIMQHFIKIDSLEGLPLAAADVDGSGYINTTDAFNAARRFAQLITSFPVGDWVFEEKMITLDENDFVTVDFMALCYGDVNRSHTPAAKASTTLSLAHKDVVPYAAGKEVVLPVSIEQPIVLGALSMVLEIPAGVAVNEVSADFTQDLIWTVNGNELRISWYSTNPVYLRQGDALMHIRVSVSSTFRGEAGFALGNESELAGAHAEVLSFIGLEMPKLASGALLTGVSMHNYPNPFRGVTSISYGLPESGHISLKVYNVLGEEVATLAEGDQLAGEYRVEFNAQGLQPGIYQYRLQVNGISETVVTRTMIVTE